MGKRKRAARQKHHGSDVRPATEEKGERENRKKRKQKENKEQERNEKRGCGGGGRRRRVGGWSYGSTETHIFVSILRSGYLLSELSGAQASSAFVDIPDELVCEVELGKRPDGETRIFAYEIMTAIVSRSTVILFAWCLHWECDWFFATYFTVHHTSQCMITWCQAV